MDNILKTLYDHFYRLPEFTPQEARITENHQLLRQRLSSRNRKLVLRIIDDKDLICSDVSLDSFICGFRLAWRIANQIQNYDGYSECSQRTEPQKTDITAEKEIQKPAPTQQTQTHKLSPSSSEPHMGDVCVVNSEKQTYIDGFGWIEDHSSEGGGTTVGNPGDEFTGNKVGQMRHQ